MYKEAMKAKKSALQSNTTVQSLNSCSHCNCGKKKNTTCDNEWIHSKKDPN